MQFLSFYVITYALLVRALIDDTPAPNQQPIQLDIDGDSFDPEFDKFVEGVLQEWHVPGLSLAVVDGDKVATKGYGYAILPDRKATPRTQYFTGSTTKAFTAAAAALLVHDDDYPDLKWNSNINNFMREDFVLEDPYATTHTTIEDALSHRSGMPRHDLIYGRLGDTPAAVVQRMRHLPLTAEPRTRFQYCNIMYGVITNLIETVTGTTLETFLRDRIWNPLGMTSTSFSLPTDLQDTQIARGYYWHSEDEETSAWHQKGRYIAEPYLEISPITGAGATISTVEDYVLWIKALLHASDGSNTRNTSSPITNAIFRDLITPRSIFPSDYGDVDSGLLLYALGWLVTEIKGEKIIAHNGGLTGFGTELYLFPGRDYGIVTMGNTAETSNIAGSIIATRLIQRKLQVATGVHKIDLQTQNKLLNIQDAMRSAISKSQRQHWHGKDEISSSAEHIPLPRPIEEFSGVYWNQGYGSINLTVGSSSNLSSCGSILEGQFYPRTFPEKEQFCHLTSTVFAIRSFQPHGVGDISSNKDVVWEYLGDSWDDLGFAKAVFEFGPSGEVERLGMELEYEMVVMARRKGPSHWRDGMVWFQKH